VSFISDYLAHTSIYESPKSFWKWSAYCAIAGVLRDNVYKRQGDMVIYPNFYVLLLASSAEHRKGNPVRLCESLVTKVRNTKIISGRSSIQAILDELARSEMNPATGKSLSGGSAFFSVPELSAGIVNDPEAIKILTDIYDFREEYTSRLRGTGTFRIKNVCFTMMAASNEELLKDVYDTKALFGGLIGRTFLIKPDEFRAGNSLFQVADKTASYDSMVEKLQGMANLRGEFRFDTLAIQVYEEWYHPFRESYRNRTDKSGVSGRIHTSVLKLAMVLCVDELLDIQIQKNHIEQAIEECMALIPNYQAFVMGGGKSPLSEVSTIVITAIYEAPSHTISRKDLLQRNWSSFDAETLDKIILTLTQAGMVDEKPSQEGALLYKMTDKCVELLFKKG
jgi:hypothetical protein